MIISTDAAGGLPPSYKGTWKRHWHGYFFSELTLICSSSQSRDEQETDMSLWCLVDGSRFCYVPFFWRTSQRWIRRMSG
uniref:Uncharacterized protein n=1 Tax=Arundo donax TaxID=35708 RepID=A0A0A9DQQ1_ARUDO